MIVDLFADYCPGLSIGSLYAGIDGLALGVQFATGARVAWHAEIDPDGGCAGGSPGKGIITAIGAAVMPMRAASHAAPVDFADFVLTRISNGTTVHSSPAGTTTVRGERESDP